MGQVSAGWALYGKRPGSSDDYGVLTSSKEPFTQAGFAKILRRYAVGTPPAHRTGDDALPWVTISWVGEAPERYLGMAVQDWTDHRDGAGRPVAFTKYVCVPYQDVETAPISYAALYREVLRLDLPMDGGSRERVTLHPPEYGSADLARDIDRFGRETVLRTAAMLLDGRVDVLHAGEVSLQDRLAFLDAVAALLPFGYRAGFTAATWATGAADKIRIAFTRRPREGAREVSWRGPGEPAPLSATADDYLYKLTEMLASGRDLPWLVGYLASASQPYVFGDPSHALRLLTDVDWPSDVARAVADGRPGVGEEARRLLHGTRLDEISATDQGRVLCYIARDGDPDDLDLVGRLWDRVAATVGDDLPEALAEGACRLLWREEPDNRVSRYVRVAMEHRAGDSFLAGLLRHPDSYRASRAARNMAARLIRDHVDLNDPGWNHSGLLLDELGRNQRLTAALLADEDRGQDRIAAWTGWLSGATGNTLAPFHTLLAAQEVRLAPFRKLADNDPDWVTALLCVAGRAGQLRQVLPAFAAWLEHADRDAKARESAVVALMSLQAGDPLIQGTIDGLLLTLRTKPRFMEGAIGHNGPEYERGFLWAWDTREADGARRTLVEGLADALRRRPWAGDPPTAHALINLVRNLLGKGGPLTDWNPLSRVLDTEPPDPDLTVHPSFGYLRTLLRRHTGSAGRPAAEETFTRGASADSGSAYGARGGYDSSGGYGAGTYGTSDTVGQYGAPTSFGAHDSYSASSGTGQLGYAATLDEVTEFYMRASNGTLGVPSTLLEVGRAGRSLTGDEAFALMGRVRLAMASRFDEQSTERHIREMAKAIVGGALGVETAGRFRALLADSASSEITRQAELLEIAGLEVHDQEAWELPVPSRTRLEEVRPVLDRVLKQGRGGGLLRRGRRG